MSEVDFAQLAEVVVPTVMFLGLFSMVVLLVWFGHRSRETESGLRAETQKRFLDKFDSGKELADFLATDNGQRFLTQIGENKSQRGTFLDRFFDPRAQARRMVVPGVILSFLGLGLLALTATGENLIAPGVIVLSLGIGFLISMALLHRISKKSDTSEGERPTETEQLP